MRRIKFILCGCLGRMGTEVSDMVRGYIDIEIVAGISKTKNKSGGYPIFRNFDDLASIDCNSILDFSHPSCLDSLLRFATIKKLPTVICTTGYNDRQIFQIKEAAESIPIFFSSSTSLGLYAMLQAAKIAKKTLNRNYDIEIIEKHHNQKLDAPSGTALMIADEISNKDSEYVYDRTNRKFKRRKNEIGIHTVRCGGISGEHEIIFANEYETITFKHSSNSRKLFANGALDALRFIFGKVQGIYTMEDLAII